MKTSYPSDYHGATDGRQTDNGGRGIAISRFAKLDVDCGRSITRSQAVARIADRILPHSTFGGHVTSSVTWPFDTPCHFLLVVLWNGVSKSSVFEILRSKRIGVTTLTFQGHVTSSVT